MSKKHKKVCATLNYIVHFLILGSAIIGCVSIFAISSLVGIPIGITSSAIGLKTSEIIGGTKKYKSLINKKEGKHDKIVLLGKSKSNSIEVLVSKALIDSVISYNEFILINNVLREYNKMKQEIKNVKS